MSIWQLKGEAGCKHANSKHRNTFYCRAQFAVFLRALKCWLRATKHAHGRVKMMVEAGGMKRTTEVVSTSFAISIDSNECSEIDLIFHVVFLEQAPGEILRILTVNQIAANDSVWGTAIFLHAFERFSARNISSCSGDYFLPPLFLRYLCFVTTPKRVAASFNLNAIWFSWSPLLWHRIATNNNWTEYWPFWSALII